MKEKLVLLIVFSSSSHVDFVKRLAAAGLLVGVEILRIFK